MIRVFTAFSGYDSQCLALNMLMMDSIHYINNLSTPRCHFKSFFTYELVGWSEIDKFAIQAHNVLFPQWADRNFGDISKIDWSQVPDFDLFTYSSPCQDFSLAGKQSGGEKGSGTRSSLLWECERAIATKRPKYLLFENVAAVVSKKFIKLFNEWQLTLERMGYSNFVQVLNAKTHGYPTPVPQNRERVFMVSILNCEESFYFPDVQPLEQRLIDVLEPIVDERYYLTDAQIQMFRNHAAKQAAKGNDGFARSFAPTNGEGVARTITTHNGQRPGDNYILVLGWSRNNDGTIKNWHPVEVANCVTAAKRDNTQNYVLEEVLKDVRKRYPERGIFLYEDKIYFIRKLTPRECFRLMGVGEAEIDKLLQVNFTVWDGHKYINVPRISNSQLYKLAGNSIVVNCLAATFRQLFIGNFNKHQQTEIFN